MSLGNRGLGTAILALVAAATLLPAVANAQWTRYRWHRPRYDYYGGSSVRIFPIPPQGYHYGGIHVYPLPGYRPWPYGYPESYRWPYGGRSYTELRREWRHRRSHW
jgi:hypothetical protein